jgi:hypothetical protein
MALRAPSPVKHPGRNLQEALCLRTVQSAAEKHAIGLLDDRVNPHLVRKLRVSRDREHGFQRIVSNDFRGS